MAQTLIQFDYSQLGKDAVSVRESTVRIKALQRSASESIVEIGKELILVKSKLGHGSFGKWVDAEFGWSHDAVSRFINVSNRFSDISQIANYGPSALYLLASPSTPDEAVAEAIHRADHGEEITHKVAKEIVARHKEPEATLAKQSIPVHAELVEDDEDIAQVQSILAGKSKRPSPEPVKAKQPDYMTEIYLKIKDTVEAIDKKYPGQQETIRYCLQKVMDYYT